MIHEQGSEFILRECIMPRKPQKGEERREEKKEKVTV